MKKRWMTVVVIAMLCGCGTTRVDRMEPGKIKDLSGYWNDTDSRLVAEAVVSQALASNWADAFQSRTGRSPVVIVGNIRNRSSEHIPAEPFIKDLERALVGSGRVRLVADSGQRGALREERMAQPEFARPETVKRLAAETGADFMLLGSISTINDKEGRREVRYYQVDVEIIDLESNEKAWMGFEKIRKYIKRARFRL